MELRQCPKGLPLSCNDVRWSKLIKKKKKKTITTLYMPGHQEK